MSTAVAFGAARAGELERQARLADARFAGDKQQLRTSGLCALPYVVHLCELALAADEFNGGRCGELRRQRIARAIAQRLPGRSDDAS